MSRCIRLKILVTNLSFKHSDLDDQNLFHSTIYVPPGVPKNLDDQTEVHSGELEH